MILDSDSALSILHKVNYYRLSAYGIGLKKDSDPEKFLDDVTLDHIFRLYCFDSEFTQNLDNKKEKSDIHSLSTQYFPCPIASESLALFLFLSHQNKKREPRHRNSLFIIAVLCDY